MDNTPLPYHPALPSVSEPELLSRAESVSDMLNPSDVPASLFWCECASEPARGSAVLALSRNSSSGAFSEPVRQVGAVTTVTSSKKRRRVLCAPPSSPDQAFIRLGSGTTEVVSPPDSRQSRKSERVAAAAAAATQSHSSKRQRLAFHATPSLSAVVARQWTEVNVWCEAHCSVNKQLCAKPLDDTPKPSNTYVFR
jgi:hypothetical protein